VLAGVLLGLVVGVGIGSRLAGTPAASALIPSSSVLDVQPDAVSQRLRDAFYAAGGSTQACVAAATVVCTRVIPDADRAAVRRHHHVV
jgi:hypothetical protein